jgi:hypothetical protein
MYNQMICGNTQTEIDRDRLPTSKEMISYLEREEENAEFWLNSRNELLAGLTVYTAFQAFNLKTWLSDKYREFADLVDNDEDFMADYKKGGLCIYMRRLIEREADVLATKILEEIK